MSVQRISIAIYVFLALWSTLDAQVVVGRPKLGVFVKGVRLAEVDAESPAAKAGLRAGDVLTKWGAEDLSDVAILKKVVESMKEPQTIEVEYLRGETTMHAKVSFTKEGLADPEEPRLGVTPVFGVRVDGIVDESAAAKAGIRAGDIIVKFGADDLESYEELVQKIAGVEENGRRTLTLMRGDATQKVRVHFAPAGQAEGAVDGEVRTGPASERPAHKDEGSGAAATSPAPKKRARFMAPAKAVPGQPGAVDPKAVPGEKAESHADGEIDFSALADPMKMFADIQSAAASLDGALALLKSPASPERDAKVQAMLTEARTHLAMLTKIADHMKQLSGSFGRFFSDPGGEGAKVVESLSHGDRQGVVDRVQQLLADHVDLDELRDIIAKEFPDVQVHFNMEQTRGDEHGLMAAPDDLTDDEEIMIETTEPAIDEDVKVVEKAAPAPAPAPVPAPAPAPAQKPHAPAKAHAAPHATEGATSRPAKKSVVILDEATSRPTK